jgi:hypothetical protein
MQGLPETFVGAAEAAADVAGAVIRPFFRDRHPAASDGQPLRTCADGDGNRGSQRSGRTSQKSLTRPTRLRSGCEIVSPQTISM